MTTTADMAADGAGQGRGEGLRFRRRESPLSVGSWDFGGSGCSVEEG
jgi:hypothetical protein